MTDTDPWERRFLDVLCRMVPEGPPAEGYLYRRAVVARRSPDCGRAGLVLAAAELLSEEGLPRPRWHGALRAALVAEPGLDGRATAIFWAAGRGDLRGLPKVTERSAAPEAETTRCVWRAMVASVAALRGAVPGRLHR